MRITALRPQGRGTPTVAYVDIEIGGLKLYGIEIRHAVDGTLRAWPPLRGKHHIASISTALAHEITRAAMIAMKGDVHVSH